MLKKELANQQKRTAAAIASQRQQTKLMADSLTSSMELSRASRSSSEDMLGENDNNHMNMEHSISQAVMSTPSPLRSSVRGGSATSPTASPESNATSNSIGSSQSMSPPEEARDLPPVESPMATRNETSPMMEDDTVEDYTSHVPSSVSVSHTESVEPLSSPEEKPQRLGEGKPPIMYSTPKRGERWAPSFHRPGSDDDDDDEHGGRLFPHSASPQVFAKKSYNEEFPSDIQAIRNDEEPKGAFDSKQQRKINLLNSIDAFEQSFSVDFPDSFTPKENTSSGKTRRTDIYNPFLNTPERSIGRSTKTDLFASDSEEEKKTNEPSSPLERGCETSSFETPPRQTKFNSADDGIGEAQIPKKSASSSARERYEKALRQPISNSNNDKPVKSNSPAALLRRLQSKRSNDSSEPRDGGETETRNSSNDIVDMVDSFEGDSGSSGRQSLSSRFGLRRNIKKPISYAEPALNTKLRQGDTFFPKVEGDSVSVVTPTSVSP
jgi:hypothetical protein